ncbi:hypothetical protein GUJ93_ZPchr0010g7658 [Zizania palustris]|uniref:Biotin synthase n=1 Tax=Zizania palustris TaxID=103762 RepID=A0A8J6BIE7_ZIZPA|nr:hypothetical protein GUJ93_ZPchr0010g7658 [Zizania palustris]
MEIDGSIGGLPVVADSQHQRFGSEDCSYCPQSSRYSTGLKAQKLMNKDDVLEAARKAKEAGSTRFCMGASMERTIGRKTNFNQIP